MFTPTRAVSVPASKRKHLDMSSPDKGQDWVKLVEECSQPGVPAYVKLILNLLLETKEQMDSMRKWCFALMEENKKLKQENEKLKKIIAEKDSLINSKMSKPLSDQSFDITESDIEKKRTIAIAGLPELIATSSIDKANHDFQSVNGLLSFLNIECVPCTVYRMGKPNSVRPRLIKVVLPTSRFQMLAIRRAPRLRSYSIKGVFVLPSLSKEEREQQREARLASKSNGVVNLINSDQNRTLAASSVVHDNVDDDSVVEAVPENQ